MGHFADAVMRHKDLLELKYWIRADLLEDIDGREAQKRRQSEFMCAFGWPYAPETVLEIGTGPYWGMLPLFTSELRIAVDPLIEVFDQAGILEERGDIRYFAEPFEQWEPGAYTFDAILCANALDHGDMGFHLLPKISRLLKPGGRFYLHVHLRPPELLNLLHDHSLTTDQLDRHLSYTPLVEVRREIHARDDISGWDCPTLIGIWEKPC